MIAFFLMSVAFVFLNAVIDGGLINSGRYIDDHSPRAMMRFIFFVFIGTVSLNFWYFIASGLMFAALFDQSLNYVRNLPFWYLGTVAKWDVFWRKNLIAYKIVKVLLLLTSLYLFIWK